MELTKEQIEALPAGRELDALLEETVFGRKVARNWPCMSGDDGGGMMPWVAWKGNSRRGYDHKEPTIGRGYQREVIPRYSSYMDEAWLVVEHMSTLLESGEAGPWWANFWHMQRPPIQELSSADAALAVCRAALIAMLPCLSLVEVFEKMAPLFEGADWSMLEDDEG